MGPGTQLLAPEGWGSFAAGETYYLVANRPKHGTALLAWFDQSGEEPRVFFIQTDSTRFEKGLLTRALVPAEAQRTLPPWLEGLEGADIGAIEEKRKSKKKSYATYADARYTVISPLVDRHERIVTALDPYLAIRRILAEHAPGKKAARLAPWYVAYMIFGCSTKALLPAFNGIGTWERTVDKLGDKKLGRPAGAGRGAGHSAIPLAARIVDAYAEFARIGVSMTEIYQTAMTRRFGCLTRRNDRNLHEYYHPQDLPFPSKEEFDYWVEKTLGTAAVQRKKLGDVRFRNKVAVSRGPFSESVTSFLERTEMDGYYAKVVPTALLSNAPDLPVCFCRLVDIASGGVVGVGAAYGSEDTDAYRSMLFCSAVDKQWFCSLLGLEIGNDDWPFQGLPLGLIGDRGPGESARVAPNDGRVVLPDRSMTPSYTPQSKATVESSHPRTLSPHGAPSYVQSPLSALGLFKRELLQVIQDNDSSDASSRHTPEMVADRVAANPKAIQQWLVARGRSDAMTLGREDAIRKFLKPVEFELNASGLWLLSQRFDSAALAESGVRQMVRKGQTIKLSGYVLPLCVRTTWLDVGGKLIEVQGQLNLRDDHEQLYLSYQELEQYHLGIREIRAEHRRHAPAARSAAETEFRKQTGTDWHAGKRKDGRPPSRASRRHGIPSPSRGKRRR